MADHQEDNDPFEEDIVFDEAGLLGGKMPRARRQATAGFLPTFMLFIRTVFLCVAFLGLGMCVSVSGGPLIKLEMSAGIPERTAFHVFTARSVGMLFGGALGSVLFEVYNRQFLLSVSLVWVAAAVTVLPFTVPAAFWWTLASTAALGTGLAFLFTGGNVLCLDLWGRRQGGAALQALHFSFSLGALVVPVVVQPFFASLHPANTTLTNLSTTPQPLTTEVTVAMRAVRSVPSGGPQPLHNLTTWEPLTDEELLRLTQPAEEIGSPNYYSSFNSSSSSFNSSSLLNSSSSSLLNSSSSSSSSSNSTSSSSYNATAVAATSPQSPSLSTPKPKMMKPAYTDANILDPDDKVAKWTKPIAIQPQHPQPPLPPPPTTVDTSLSSTTAAAAQDNLQAAVMNGSVSSIGTTGATSATNVTSISNNNDTSINSTTTTSTNPAPSSSSNHSDSITTATATTAATTYYSTSAAAATTTTTTAAATTSSTTTATSTPTTTTTVTAAISAVPTTTTTTTILSISTVTPAPTTPTIMATTTPTTATTATATPTTTTTTKDTAPPPTSTTEAPHTVTTPTTTFAAPPTIIKPKPTLVPIAATKPQPFTTSTIAPAAPPLPPSPFLVTMTDEVYDDVIDDDVDGGSSEAMQLTSMVVEGYKVQDLREPPLDSGGDSSSSSSSGAPSLKPGTFSNASEEFKPRFLEHVARRLGDYGVTRVHLAYISIGILVVVDALVSVVVLCHHPREARSRQEGGPMASERPARTLLFTVLFSTFMFAAEALQGALHHLLAGTGGPTGLSLAWGTEGEGPDGQVVFWGLVCLVRFLCVPAAGCLGPRHGGLLSSAVFFSVAGTIFLVVGADGRKDFVWAGVVFLAVGCAPVLPTSLLWMAQHMRVTHRLCALMVVVASFGNTLTHSLLAGVTGHPSTHAYVLLGLALASACLLGASVCAVRAGQHSPNLSAPVGYQLASQHEEDSLELTPSASVVFTPADAATHEGEAGQALLID